MSTITGTQGEKVDQLSQMFLALQAQLRVMQWVAGIFLPLVIALIGWLVLSVNASQREVVELRGETKRDIAELRSETTREIGEVRSDIKTLKLQVEQIDKTLQKIDARLDKIEERLSKLEKPKTE